MSFRPNAIAVVEKSLSVYLFKDLSTPLEMTKYMLHLQSDNTLSNLKSFAYILFLQKYNPR